MKFRRNFLSRLYRSPEPGDDGAGVVDTTPAAGATPDPAAAGGAATEPTMLETMFGQTGANTQPTEAEAAEAAAAGKTVQQLRDERGRFAGKAPEGQAQAGATPDPTKKPANPNDPTTMPEGLTPKAQERFQALANSNKELTAKVHEYEPIVQSALGLQEVFQSNGIKREQFEQAMDVVGLMNRGDLRGALKALDEQRALISMHLGEPIPGADALANFPDLRAEVDNLQMTEARALEIARGRTREQQAQQANQQQRQEQQRQHQEQQAAQREQQMERASLLEVDKFCKARMADDMDYARIEPLLLKEIQGGLLEGVPYQRRAALVEKTYNLIKQTATATRASGGTTPVLRPTGGESPRQAPGNTFEAMFGAKA
jgi:hypothetical protein